MVRLWKHLLQSQNQDENVYYLLLLFNLLQKILTNLKSIKSIRIEKIVIVYRSDNYIEDPRESTNCQN